MIISREGIEIFQNNSTSGIDLWTGIPNCQAAHDALLAILLRVTAPLAPHVALGTRRQGNLGEFVAFFVARNKALNYTHVFALNVFSPLQDISSPGLDLTYAYFDERDPQNDLVYLQEVKTTGGLDLAYADSLTGDYRKLFGEDPALTLNTRLQGVSGKLEYADNRPDLADRIRQLCDTTASRCTRVNLVPTLVHERIGTTPAPKMMAIKTAITALGWAPSQIAPWSIAMDDLINRLTRLSRGLN